MKIYDVVPLLTKVVFRALQDQSVFHKVRVCGYSVIWPGEIDIAPESLYQESISIEDWEKSIVQDG